MSTTLAAEALAAGIAERERALRAFVEADSERLARACHAMARSFARGGTLIPFGSGAAATDAAHAAVEFMHPVIVGKRALPAIAPTSDPSGEATVERIARAYDIALAVCHGPLDPPATRFLDQARRRGLLTIALSGGAAGRDAADIGPEPGGPDFVFRVPSENPEIVQEIQETAYHVLWELVHVFFEHPGLLDDACITCGDVAVRATVVSVADSEAVIEKDGARETIAIDLVEGVEPGNELLCHAGVALEKLAPEAPADAAESGSTGFLYPFLEQAESDPDSVLADVSASTVHKAADVIALRAEIDCGAIERCAALVRERLDAGGHVLAFGNGGSSTDAQDLATDLLARGWPGASLTNDPATVTAVGNDVGFDKVFSRQLIALGRPRDVAVAITTSGSSANVVAGLEEAHRRRMATIAITGYDGGRLAELDWLDHLFIVRSDYIPRIQEAQASIYHLLCAAVGARR